ncbi:MAG: T9SS type A sorting domain-containing protein [Candidatus Cloacimonetes bacterium]|nr:T9SS type A sorting domain-containing protein [Candidatus Cloacimonadota bacterium]
MQRNCIEKRAKTLIIRNRILCILFMSLFIILNAAWLENIPTVLTQPDDTQIEAFLSGDEFHNWAHDEDGFTIILDPVTGFWCWAIAEDGDLVSTGQPIHLVSRETLNISPNENISEDRYKELRLPFDEEFGADTSRTPATGVIQNIVIFIRFSSEPEFIRDFIDFETIFNEEKDFVKSKYQYLYESSYGLLEVNSNFYPENSGTSVISYESNHKRSYFIPYNAVTNPNGYQSWERKEREHQLVKDAIEYVQNQIPHNLIIDSDNNGTVDNVSFVFSRGIASSILWPHKWMLDSHIVHINGKRVWNYYFVHEGTDMTTLAHEFLHSIGMPDLYRYSNQQISPVGIWDIMASNNSLVSISAFMKWEYTEWINELPLISQSGTYMLSPITEQNPDYPYGYRIASPFSDTEFFVVEYRKKNEIGNIDQAVPGSGLIVYRINTRDHGGNLFKGNSLGPPDNVYVYRPNGTLTVNGSIGQAFFSQQSGRTAINRYTNPTPFLSNGNHGGLNITDIGYAGDFISFYFPASDIIFVGINECIQSAIDMITPGGTILLDSGEFDIQRNLYINGKNLKIIGNTNMNNPTIINGGIEISNVSNYTTIENISFNHPVGQSLYVALSLSDATPILTNLTFNLSNNDESTGIFADFSRSEIMNILEISDSQFIQGQGISFHGIQDIATILRVNNCEFFENYDHLRDIGSAIDFHGSSLFVSDSIFIQDTDVYLDERTNLRPVQTVNINLTSIGDTQFDKEIIFSNNKFITSLNDTHFYANDIGVYGYDNSNFLFERNIFSTIKHLGTTQPVNRIIFADSQGSFGSSIRLFNNTDVFQGSHNGYNFIEHNIELLAKNNLFTGAIYSDSPNAINEVYYSWFVDPNQQNFPPNSFTDHLYYGDPEVDYETFQPLWNEDFKSGLVDAGDPDSNDNGISWWDDPEDQDPDGTRLDIGAVPTIPHGYIRHRFKSLPGKIVNLHGDYYWVSFPFLDKRFQGTINGHSAGEINYNLHQYNDNELMVIEPNRILDYIAWEYNGSGSVVYDDKQDIFLGGDHILDSRYGYKVKMLPGMESDIIVSGFLAGEYGNEEDIITIEPINSQNQIWVGYFKEQSECPLYALQEIDPWLISIQTQRWTIGRRASQGPWMTSAINPRLNFGDTVVLSVEGHPELNFTWQISENATTERYVHPMASFFEYEEQIDYVPVYVYLPDDISVEGIGEIGMFVNSLCIGAEPIMGDMVQINAYILGMDLEDADIEFQYFEYGSRAGVRNIANYTVLDQELQVFQAKSLDLGNGDRFYVVSFKGDDNQLPEIPEKTFLEGNIPNPFNPFTTIRYHLSQQENVSLRIYNIRGQLVKTLVNEIQDAGIYSVIWNGDNTRGNRVASGVYFYRFETNNITEVKRMVLLK